MGNTASATQSIESPTPAPANKAADGEKPKCKACCACPETKKIRDEWYVAKFLVLLLIDFPSFSIMQNGEENCGDLIEKHKQCMRDLGFKI